MEEGAQLGMAQMAGHANVVTGERASGKVAEERGAQAKERLR